MTDGKQVPVVLLSALLVVYSCLVHCDQGSWQRALPTARTTDSGQDCRQACERQLLLCAHVETPTVKLYHMHYPACNNASVCATVLFSVQQQQPLREMGLTVTQILEPHSCTLLYVHVICFLFYFRDAGEHYYYWVNVVVQASLYLSCMRTLGFSTSAIRVCRSHVYWFGLKESALLLLLFKNWAQCSSHAFYCNCFTCTCAPVFTPTVLNRLLLDFVSSYTYVGRGRGWIVTFVQHVFPLLLCRLGV